MADTSALGQSQNLGASSASAATRSAFSELTSDEFFKIMFAELNNQDPLAPSDSKALLDQLSTLRSMQSDMDLSSDLKSMVARDEMASAANLLGKRVRGVSEAGRRITSDVTSIYRTSNGATLGLADGSRMSMSGLEEVVTPSAGSPTGSAS